MSPSDWRICRETQGETESTRHSQEGDIVEPLMAQQVGNLAEACTAVDQSARCRMAEHVGAAKPTERNPSAPQVALDDLGDRGGITETAGRIVDAHEQAETQPRGRSCSMYAASAVPTSRGKGNALSRCDLRMRVRMTPACQSMSPISIAMISAQRNPNCTARSSIARSRHGALLVITASSKREMSSVDRRRGKLACAASRVLGIARSRPLGTMPRQARNRRNDRTAVAGTPRLHPFFDAASSQMKPMIC
jgi:hypothetical protein